SDGSEWSVHAPHFNSLPEARGIYGGPFGSGYEWAVLSKAMIYLDQGGRHCFEVSGQVDGQMCRSLFLDEGATALGVADGVYCEDLEAGIYPISWFVVGGRTGDGDSPLGESYSFNYCFGGAEDCNPTGPIPLEMLRPEHDGNGVCLRDDDCDDGLSCCGSGRCGSDCPPDSGGPPAVCQDDVECLIGEVCSDIAPFALGLPDLFQSVCWNGGCASGTTNCGTPDALCGNCVCQPSCENKECGDSP